jgi:hypothetical protein
LPVEVSSSSKVLLVMVRVAVLTPSRERNGVS